MQVGLTTGYTGPDRRRSTSGTRPRWMFWRAFFTVCCVLGIWGLFAYIVIGAPAETQDALISLTHALAGALILTSATLRFAQWRITRTSRAAWSVVALLIAGFAIPTVGVMNRLLATGHSEFAPASITRGFVELALVGIGIAALKSPGVVAKLKPLRTATPFVIATLALSGIVIIGGTQTQPPTATTIAAAVITANLPIIWCGLAVAFIMSGVSRRKRADIFVGAVLLIPMVDAFARTIIGPAHYQEMLASAAVELLMACIVTASSGMALWTVESGRDHQLAAVHDALQGARTDLAEHERDEAIRLHDARNAMLAVSGAVRLLAAKSADIDDGQGASSTQLQRLVTAELDRLGSLLDPKFRRANKPFRLAPVLEPVVLAHRLAAKRLSVDIVDCEVIGDPESTATAIANILANTRNHAPGARVWLTARPAGSEVQIRISDDGPGIPASQRQLVVLPGVRGTTDDTPGSGIGLASAAQAMSEQGGTLRIDERPGGGTMITLAMRGTEQNRTDTTLPPPQEPARSGLATLRRTSTWRAKFGRKPVVTRDSLIARSEPDGPVNEPGESWNVRLSL